MARWGQRIVVYPIKDQKPQKTTATPIEEGASTGVTGDNSWWITKKLIAADRWLDSFKGTDRQMPFTYNIIVPHDESILPDNDKYRTPAGKASETIDLRDFITGATFLAFNTEKWSGRFNFKNPADVVKGTHDAKDVAVDLYNRIKHPVWSSNKKTNLVIDLRPGKHDTITMSVFEKRKPDGNGAVQLFRQPDGTLTTEPEHNNK